MVVSRWVSEAGKIRIEDDNFAADLETLDQALSTKAIERLEELKAASRQSQESFSWHRFSVHWFYPVSGRRIVMRATSIALILATSLIGLPAAAEDPPPVSEATEMCLMCHESLHPGIVAGWRSSRHAAVTPAQAMAVEGLARKVSSDDIPEDLSRDCCGLRRVPHPASRRTRRSFRSQRLPGALGGQSGRLRGLPHGRGAAV